MKILLRLIFYSLFFPAVAYAAGVRVHPEVFAQTPAAPQVTKAVDLKLKNGQILTGQIVKQTPQGIVFTMDGATMDFTNAEISSMKEVDRVFTIPGTDPGLEEKIKSFVTYDPELNLVKQLTGKSQPQKKVAAGPAASTLWAKKSKSAPVSAGAKPAAPGSVMDIYQKSMSKESMEAWKEEAVAGLNQGRNPFVEAFKYGGKTPGASSAGSTDKSEAKLKELAEQGY